MYHHILVPLDGSQLAEQVIPHVESIVSHDDTRITLLRSVPLQHAATVEFGNVYSDSPLAQEEIARAESMAQDYLNAIAVSLRAEGFHVQTELSRLPAAEAIIHYAEHHHVDLIAIATHGRSGVSRWIFGSVTQKIVQASPVPVLVIRPKLKTHAPA